ncbi:MAG: hypothetical protein JWN04_5152 [Myxococcaceae bacterium]|nr:hypothetical protein [Myxococcaceae bacterium]
MRNKWLRLTLSLVASLAACTQASERAVEGDASTEHPTGSDASSPIIDASKGQTTDADASKKSADGGSLSCRTRSECSGQHDVCFDVYGTCGPNLDGLRCATDSDCSRGTSCREPGDAGTARVCGAAATCSDDAQCDGGRICSRDGRPPFYDPASAEDTFCLSPCASDSHCAPTDKCDTEGHCRARTCAECPSYFSCTTDACEISACAADADCPGGHCVNQRCQATLGTCGPLCL